VREFRSHGSVRGALSNERPYREHLGGRLWVETEHSRRISAQAKLAAEGWHLRPTDVIFRSNFRTH
jgi:hypothetical protein